MDRASLWLATTKTPGRAAKLRACGAQPFAMELKRKRKMFSVGASRLLWITVLMTVPLHAARLPVKTFSTADGLPSDMLHKIVRDSRGFLWFCTSEGLARFDGYGFTTHNRRHGLPPDSVSDLLETPAGDFWIATNRGLGLYHPSSPKRFETIILPDGARANPDCIALIRRHYAPPRQRLV
ncbi:MAG: ligand-binding sensor domain-containing protein [Bryobacteraceae bacterium]